jgi:bile acid-coenzyme A ligase
MKEARANRKAGQLAASGVGQGDVVTLILPNGPDFFETVFAVWKLGAIPNNVPASLAPADFLDLIQLAKPRLIIGAAQFECDGYGFLPADSRSDKAWPSEPLRTKIAPRWKIQTSSGSTSQPKLIVDTAPGAYDLEHVDFGPLPGETLLNIGPMSYNPCFVTACRCLFSGGHVIEMQDFDAAQALELIERHRVAWLSLVPSMMHRIWRLPGARQGRGRMGDLGRSGLR